MKSSIKDMDARKKIVLGASGAGVLIAGAAFAYMQPSVEMVPAAPPVLPPVGAATGVPGIAPVTMRPAPVAAAPTSVGGASSPVTAQTDPAPVNGDPLAEMDTLRADIERAKLRAELAKYQAQERDATNPTSAPTSMSGGAVSSTTPSSLPPMPIFPVGGGQMAPSLDMPPLPPNRSGMAQVRPRSTGAGGLQFLEAWGAGNDIQARVETSTGERIVKVGDAVAGGRVSSITGSALVVRDAKGNSRTFN